MTFQCTTFAVSDVAVATEPLPEAPFPSAVNAAEGRLSREFWQSIYKFGSISGGAVITGWIAAFLPYLKDESGDISQRNPWLQSSGEGLQRLLSGAWRSGYPSHDDGPSPGDLPSGLARAPFRWAYFDQQYDMELIGGFVGVAQDRKTLTLRPEIGWVVRQR